MNLYTISFPAGRRLLLLAGTLVLFSPLSLRADGVIQMNLREMVQRAGKIFRGTVVAFVPGTIKVGGGELPIVTYRIKVDENFEGEVHEIKGVRFTEIRMLRGIALPSSMAL